MLRDVRRAAAIIRQARQRNVATAWRGAREFGEIFRDFFRDVDLRGKRVLDLGPGHFTFAKRVRRRGGATDNLDNDPAVLELGRFLGFDVIEGDIRGFDATAMLGRYDGLFCKFAVNAFWFDDPASVQAHVRKLDSVIRDRGFGWVAPWNGPGPRDPTSPLAASLLRAQVEAFEAQGWRTFMLDPERAAFYGVSGKVVNHPLFVKNLPAPRDLAPLRFRARRHLVGLVRRAGQAVGARLR